jgi:hypothetical protein
VKLRPEDTTSERQLVIAMVASGRFIALRELVRWRSDGLLPPLASTGSGNGRCYYWREPDILIQAQTAYDALNRYGRVDAALIALWLGGFAVPLPRLRRAWLHSRKTRKATAIRQASAPKRVPTDLASALQQASLGMAAAFAPDAHSNAGLKYLEATSMRLGFVDTTATRQHWLLAQSTVASLADSALLQQASYEELLRAQHIAGQGLDFVWQHSSANDRADIVNALGETAFLYALAMICSGQEIVLEGALHWMTARRPARSYNHDTPLQLRA